MSLKHKGLAFDSVPWHFTEKDKLDASGGARVPVIVDNGKWQGDSWEIADYLDATYTDAPSLMADKAARARARFVAEWCNRTLFATLRPLAVAAVFDIIAAKDRDYFRQSREQALGDKIENISKDFAAEAVVMNKTLAPAESALGDAPFFGGETPDFADYVLFGTLMWPYTVCTQNPIDMQTNVGAWFGRLLDLHNGYARSAPTARD